MTQRRAETVNDYLASLPDERRNALSKVRNVIRKNLSRGFEEGIQLGMIAYYVPLSRHSDTYNGQPLMLAALASQKHYMSLYLIGVYSSPDRTRWFQSEYRKSGKRLDMGKSCVRFASVDDLPLDLVKKAIASERVDDFIARCEAARAGPRRRPARRSAESETTAKATKRARRK